MKSLEKITSVRLAEILTERAVVSSEVITDALYAQDKHGEPFVQVLVSGGHITEWDLAKIVTENFNLPFLMAGNYQISSHIYSNHHEQVELQLARTPYPYPKLHIKRRPASIFDYEFEDFEMLDYQCHPAIKAPVAV